MQLHGVESYRTPQKHWLNDAAKAGRAYSEDKIEELSAMWEKTIDVSLIWFAPKECFRRIPVGPHRAINRALFDLEITPSGQTIVKPTALGLGANTDTKLLIYGLFQKGRVLAQDGNEVCPPSGSKNRSDVKMKVSRFLRTIRSSVR